MSTALRAVRCPLLIGRDDLLELADRRLDDVIAGRGQFLLIAGQAGIGKTRFLEVIVDKARARGFCVSGGAVSPQDREVPAASLMDMARSMLRQPPFVELGRQLLEIDQPALAAARPNRRRLVIDTVELILASLPGPTMLAFEDLQWADEVSLEIVAELARRSRDRSLLLTADYRSEDVPRGMGLRDWRARLVTQRIAEEVRLTPLDPAETALVTTLIIGTGLPAPRDVAAAVYERTDGIPLHIEELLGALPAEARTDGAAIREATVPETIEDAVVARIARLSPEAQATARAGAVIGRCFIPAVLAGIMDVPPASLDAPLQELVDQFVLDPPGLRGLYDFRHQLLRDALYRTIPASDVRRLHARVGDLGSGLEGSSEIHASVHYERAGLARQAFDAALAGAREAARLSAHREAFELYRRAVANAPADLDPLERATILAAYANQAAAIEELELAERVVHEAIAAYRAAGRPVAANRTMAILSSIWRRQARPVSVRISALRTRWAELEGMAGDDEVAEARTDAAYDLGIALIDAHDLPEARATLAAVHAFGDRAGGSDWALVADWKDAYAAVVEGGVEAGLARIGDVARAAEREGFEEVGVSAYRDASTLAVTALDYAAAAHWIGEGLRYADSIEQSHCAHVMRATSAMVSWARGDLPDAELQAQQAVSDRGCRRAAAMARWALGYVALVQGDLDAATEALADALASGTASEEIALILPPLWGLAEVAQMAGEPDRALALCRDALARAEASGELLGLVPFVLTGVRAAQRAGRPAEAAAWLAACATRVAPISGVAEPALAHARGLVALADGATGVARVALATAIAEWDRRGRSWESAWARVDLAQCLVRSNRYAEAVSLAAEAGSAAERLGSRMLADEAAALLRKARGHAADDEPWRPLTVREFEVARLIAEGYTNADIATALGIAPKTASSHVEHILAKLGASRRTEIATWASHVQPLPAASHDRSIEPIPTG